ncbi:phosphoribosyltransferase family protein [Fundidesulfovibrio butyratiphilus]
MNGERPCRESGEKYRMTVEGLDYAVDLPWVWLPADQGFVRIASLNLVGQTRLNADLGRLLADKLAPHIRGKARVGMLTVVEKGLQLAQVVAERLGFSEIAVAHNRLKPHMEPHRRPYIQVGADSITSGDKFLALYERDLNVLAEATDGVILLDDVISTGSTILALQCLLEETARIKRLPEIPRVLATACVAVEGACPLSSLISLATLPAPVRGDPDR